MVVNVNREAPKLWRKISTELFVEISLLAENWKYLLAGIFFQYLHGLAAHGIHYLHRPGPTLQDAGFFFLPELGKQRAYMSESLFSTIFCSFALWNLEVGFDVSFICYAEIRGACGLFTLSFFRAKKSTQFLCGVGFLPFWLYNCLFQGSKLARLPPPQSVLEVLLINFPRGVIYGCGDLIFSSHMIFTLVFVRTYQIYGSKRCIKQFGWVLAVIQSLLIIASRKHYTVDVVVAWYTVNLVVFFLDKKLPEMPDRSSGSTSILPLTNKDKDSKNKEELQKLTDINSMDRKIRDRNYRLSCLKINEAISGPRNCIADLGYVEEEDYGTLMVSHKVQNGVTLWEIQWPEGGDAGM
ncbi:hypothetical protein FEM48_Zijuj02G0062400 [Ziziphus jujuba var. spinosa]|uniref:Sphingomyelin synthase-like domain-containing protein n=1 Tax=Ziziphus jujuba var. spinosa TaxID=714518 RepID=A0A978VU38_ZIZJJ|nr:hypothetical protein FEM48_Zijuj02G0062400 [Ziziphus jujuba var. spinosa]